MGFGARRGFAGWGPGFGRMTNLLPNPGFEANHTDGWHGTASTLITITTDEHSGHYAMQVLNALANGATRSAYYDIPDPGAYSGQTVTFSAWVKDVDAAGAGARIQLACTGDTDISTTVLGPPNTYRTVSLVIPAGNALLRIYVVSIGPGGGAQNGCRADDLVVTAR